MAIDRNKFKDTTKLTDLAEQDKKVENLNQQKNQNNRAGYLTIENGENKFRIYPPHPNEKNNPFIQAKQIWWMPHMWEERDEDNKPVKDKKGNPVLKKGTKRIFDARIHSLVGRDIVSEYITFLENTFKDKGLKEEEVAEKMLPVFGSYQKKVNGIVGKPGWVIYCDKYDKNGNKTFGRLEMGKAVKQRLNDLISRENADEPIGTVSVNPFTDIEDGRLLIVEYNKEATKAADYYTTEIDTSYDKETKMVKFYPLTDADLEAFEKQPSLNELFVDVYTSADFEQAVDGLKMFDEDHKFGIFEHEKFIEICNELAELYPEPKEEGEQGSTSGGSGDEISKLDRTGLKELIRDKGMPIVVKQKMTDDEIRKEVRAYLAQEEPEGTDDDEIEQDATPLKPKAEVDEKVEETKPSKSAASKLSDKYKKKVK